MRLSEENSEENISTMNDESGLKLCGFELRRKNDTLENKGEKCVRGGEAEPEGTPPSC